MDVSMWMICLSAVIVIMIEANKLIFPSPHHDSLNETQLYPITPNLIYIPKGPETPTGCMCHTITQQSYNLSSALTTARSHQQLSRRPVIKIQPSKQLKITIKEPAHKRSSTRLINLVTSNTTTAIQNAYSSLKTPRDMPRTCLQDGLWTQRFQKYLVKRKSKFLSDELYQQEECGQPEGKVKLDTIPINSYRFIDNESTNLGSKLWSYKKQQKISSIPCLFYQGNSNNQKIIVYFHGNGEDIIGCASFMKKLSANLQVSLLAVEYPGYSVYEGTPSCEEIEKNAVQVLQFLTDSIGYQLSNIIVMGRSIGSGPAIYLSNLFSVCGLILISPFLSLCQVVGDLYGSLASHLLKQRFDNKERAKQVRSPCMIVHGTRDRMIPQRHATELSQYFQGYCKVRLVSNMSHSLFNHDDFFSFVKEFIQTLD